MKVKFGNQYAVKHAGFGSKIKVKAGSGKISSRIHNKDLSFFPFISALFLFSTCGTSQYILSRDVIF